MSDNYSTRAVPNRRDDMLPTSTYIKNRVDELKQDAKDTKECLRETANAVVRLDEMCFAELGRIDRQLLRIEKGIQDLTGIAERQAKYIEGIHSLVKETLEQTQAEEDHHHPTVRWGLVPPNGKEPQGRGGSGSGSERQFDMNEDF